MWREISFVVERELVETWSDALLEAGAASVQAEDADADSPDEQALFGEPGMPQPDTLGWHRTRLCALLPAADDYQKVFGDAATLAGAEVPLDFSIRTFADEDWVRLTQSQFEPIHISERLVITPTWHLNREQPEAAVSPARPATTLASATPLALAPAARLITIVLDPGLAFGTGSHPTTRLCLRWLDQNLEPGQSLLDYGCGSGILAIAAAKLGARPIWGVDIDDQAVRSSADNARLNQVTIEFRSTRAAPPPSCEVVVANILATPLRLLAPMLESLVVPGGHLILAGLLERQIAEVSAAYSKIQLRPFATEDGWTCLVGRRLESGG